MASLLRHSRSLISRFATAHRTAATSGTQARTSGVPANHGQAARSTEGSNMAVRDAQKRLTPADAIKPRPAGETPLVPLVGKSMTAFGNIGLGVVLALSVYFVYYNFIVNPEFHKSLKLSREAGKRGSHEQPANRAGSIGQQIDAANQPKGPLNPHL